MKKIPTRKCLATNTVYPKDELFRVVRTPEMTVILDIGGRANGRGAYVHKDVEAINLAKKTKCLDRALEIEVPESIYERMMLFLKLK